MAKVFVYEPKENFEGLIEIEVPNYKERIALCQEVGLSSNLSETEILGKASDLYDLAAKHVKKIEIVFTATEKDFNSLEELSYSKEGSELINEIAQIILNGIPLGNK